MFKVIEGKSTYFTTLKTAESFLKKKKLSNFAAEWLMRERLGWDKTNLIQQYQVEMSKNRQEQFEADINLFVSGQPMQQIIGHEWFYNRKFKIDEHTLIPRPETEAWFDQVLTILPQEPLKVLDIGTGSGVLAISQKLERPTDEVIATDISSEALGVARINAKRLNADVTFREGNLLEPVIGDTFDVVLCNPPYISKDEIALMDVSVLTHEPSTALFAEEDGLAIYQELGKNLEKILNKRAFVFLEIGYAQGDAVKAIFQQAFPEAKVDIWQDYNELDRVVVIYLEENDKK